MHREKHRAERIGWLRAAVLGANDGIVSTASLLVGVAAADPARSAVILAGVAGLAAGAMSMAAGEYVSVSSQADTERADRGRERRELAEQPELELAELEGIYVKRGLTASVAKEVARQLTERGALEAHLRDELGLSGTLAARPVQAALASAGTFSVGAALPLVVASVASATTLAVWISVASLLSLALLGAVSAAAGGSPLLKPTVRVTLWGALAMALTAVVGRLAGAVL
jgi:VIT1/CCC1 family predicted Fe2+/Mn2+ transporter